jgi:hypothetical protein
MEFFMHSILCRRMRLAIWILFAFGFGPAYLQAKVVIFWQHGFPTAASEPLDSESILRALASVDTALQSQPVLADEAMLASDGYLAGVNLLVLPYGSAFPVDAWKSIQAYLAGGGNLLILGGQPMRVPVQFANGHFAAEREQDTYSRAIGFRHTYQVPVKNNAAFHWKAGYSWLPALQIRARRFFTLEGRLDGFGYMADSSGQLAAAPVVVANGWNAASHSMTGGRIVALDFDPEPGYWQSSDGISLIHQAALHAIQGATEFSVETEYADMRPSQKTQLTIHWHCPREERLDKETTGEVKLELLSGEKVISTASVPIQAKGNADVDSTLHLQLPNGFYKVSATYSEDGKPREFYQNGFWVTDHHAVAAGPVLGVQGDFLSLDGKPFFPVGTNYFTTEENGWDFSGPRNAWVWEKDFADMEAHGVSFVRTGVWMNNARFIDPATGGANERFLRNVEAFLLCAQRHHIAVNFTFFAFSPRSGTQSSTQSGTDEAIPPNPYLDPAAIVAQQAYIRSVVERFKDVPWLSWDLINEPSFSNQRHIFSGNYPNGDPVEVTAWHKWLREKYVSLSKLSDAWSAPEDTLASFDTIPLVTIADMHYDRNRNPSQIRALDYNLFAQDMFIGWVKTMVETIHGTGSKQLIDVGQDEGGVTDRVLNQFYGGAGVSFTTNHTYWQDDALLWDSIAARRPGVPNITGETGYQPSWSADGEWRYDELTGLGLTERKWALGFAAGSSGAMQWDWAREVDFGMQRSDGSAKAWQGMMRDLGAFARQAAPYADKLIEPDVAIVLPQSYQLSVSNGLALEAQKTAVRALYNYARGQAYAAGEYQTELLGSPKLILLPSPYGLTESAWQAIEKRVSQGAVLLVTGPFGEDAHFHSTGRQDAAGLPYALAPLTLRDSVLHFPGGDEPLVYSGNKTTTLNRAALPDGKDWVEKPFGQGRILFSALPIELNDNLRAVADVYTYAMKLANIAPAYTTTIDDPGILICPTQYPNATLYVLTSESNREQVSFTDARSGATFSGTLPSGRAALLLVGTDGKLLATYHWPPVS